MNKRSQYMIFYSMGIIYAFTCLLFLFGCRSSSKVEDIEDINIPTLVLEISKNITEGAISSSPTIHNISDKSTIKDILSLILLNPDIVIVNRNIISSKIGYSSYKKRFFRMFLYGLISDDKVFLQEKVNYIHKNWDSTDPYIHGPNNNIILSLPYTSIALENSMWTGILSFIRQTYSYEYYRSCLFMRHQAKKSNYLFPCESENLILYLGPPRIGTHKTFRINDCYYEYDTKSKDWRQKLKTNLQKGPVYTIKENIAFKNTDFRIIYFDITYPPVSGYSEVYDLMLLLEKTQSYWKVRGIWEVLIGTTKTYSY